MEKSIKEWEKEKRAVILTNQQWSKLTTFLIMSTNYREKEAKAWAELAEEKHKDGSLKFQNAMNNAEFWKEISEELEIIRKIIDQV